MQESDRILLTSNGRKLVRDGSRLVVVATGTKGTAPLLLIPGLMVTMGGLFTLVYVPLGILGVAPWPIGPVALVVTIASGTLLWWAARTRRRLDERPWRSRPVIAIFDFETDQLLDRRAEPVAPIGNVVIRRRRSWWNTAAYRLLAEWPGGSIELVRDSLFSAGPSTFAFELSRYGLRLG